MARKLAKCQPMKEGRMTMSFYFLELFWKVPTSILVKILTFKNTSEYTGRGSTQTWSICYVFILCHVLKPDQITRMSFIKVYCNPSTNFWSEFQDHFNTKYLIHDITWPNNSESSVIFRLSVNQNWINFVSFRDGYVSNQMQHSFLFP